MWTTNKGFNLKSTKIKLIEKTWIQSDTHTYHISTQNLTVNMRKRMSSYLKLTFVNWFSALVKNDKNAIHILSLHQYPIMCMKNLKNWKKDGIFQAVTIVQRVGSIMTEARLSLKLWWLQIIFRILQGLLLIYETIAINLQSSKTFQS